MGIKVTNADKAFSQAVRMRDGCCVVCGSTETLQCCHVYGRRTRATRYSFDNAVTMCAYHHRYTTENPLEMWRIMSELWGESRLDILREKNRGILKENKAVRAEIAAHYRAEMKKKEEDPDYEMISYN